jgi:hypothetical protein
VVKACNELGIEILDTKRTEAEKLVMKHGKLDSIRIFTLVEDDPRNQKEMMREQEPKEDYDYEWS